MDDSSLAEIYDAQKSYAIYFAAGSLPVEHRSRIEQQWFRPVHMADLQKRDADRASVDPIRDGSPGAVEREVSQLSSISPCTTRR